MLKAFRNKKVAKAVLWALLILILPAFVLWGSGSLGKGANNGPACVGLIDGKKVSFDDFALNISAVRCQVMMSYFNNQKALESLLKNKPFIGKVAWDRLIILRKAKAAGLKVPDNDVVKLIGSYPLFVRDGRFDDRIYEYFLKVSLGLYPRNFEEMTRENIMIQRLTESLTKNIKISDEEISRDYERENARFKISYIFFPLGPHALEEANKAYEKLIEAMLKKNISFEAAALKSRMKTQESKPFSKSDNLDAIGEMAEIAAMAANMNKDALSKPVSTKNGALIFRVTDRMPADAEKFKKDKEAFTDKALGDKKNAFMEDWLKAREKDAELKIDLKDYEKYYK
ncbi:MAG: SurA N-terminal domain-containing protein [Candidatus Omnitrophota bacterium]|nr:SurA N-terminal domain-containing protein [Candidatus Omnitrophota bacterium]